MRWTEAQYLEDPIECNQAACLQTAVYWLDLDETDEIVFLCERHITARIIEKLHDDTQESGVPQ